MSDDKKTEYKVIILKNLISEMKVLVNYVLGNGLAFKNPENIQNSQWLIDSVPSEGTFWSPKVSQVIEMLWKDDMIQEIWNLRGVSFQINETSD